MLKEEGRVVAVRAGTVKVAFHREKKCDNCVYCEAANNGKYMVAEAENRKQAGLGDTVLILAGKMSRGRAVCLLCLALFLSAVGFASFFVFGNFAVGIVLGAVPLSALFVYFTYKKDRMQVVRILYKAGLSLKNSM